MTPSPPPAAPTSAPPAPRYRGLPGAVRYALTFTVLGLLFGAFAGSVLWLGTRNLNVALDLGGRAALVCAAAGVAAALARWICGGESDRLLTVHFVKGEVAGLLGFLAALVLVGYFAERRAAAGNSARPRKTPPVELAGPTLEGGRFDAAEHRGRVVLVAFWASWDKRSVEELARLRALYDKHAAEGLRLVGVSLDVTRPPLEKFLKANPLPWPQIFFDGPDASGGANLLAKRFNVKNPPYLLVLDREGRLFARGAPGTGIDGSVTRALGKMPPPAPLDLLRWWFTGVMLSPWWLLLGCCVGAAVFFAVLEAGLRRALRRPRASGV